MLSDFKGHTAKCFPELQNEKFLLACSGGMDSTVLAHLCHKSKLNFALAHCNFKLRGTDSDKDEDFVKQLAVTMGKEFFVTHFDTIGYVNKNRVSVQMAARELRYAWFEEIMAKNDSSILLTAHHADDDLETFLINLSRGTGIDGLTGIPSKTQKIRRPLLIFSREQLLNYARANKLQWREDASNTDTKYLRNKIRHELLPALKELHPTFLENFKNTKTYLSQTEEIANNHLLIIKKRLFTSENGLIKIPISELQQLKPIRAYLYGLFNEYSFKEWDNIEELLNAMSGKYVKSLTHKLVKDRDFLLLSELNSNSKILECYSIEEEVSEITIPLKMKFSIVENRKDNSDNVIYVAKNALNYPLTIRKWNNGDYFYPFGFKGKKKLAKYFKDEKIDVLSKEKQWLLCADDEIVWVIGRRGDNRFRVLEDTREILRIEVNV